MYVCTHTQRDLLKAIKLFYNKKVSNGMQTRKSNTTSQTASATTNCAGCFVLNTCHICAPITYMCPMTYTFPYDIHVSQWHICAPITYMCSYDIHVLPWQRCTPMTYICPYNIYIYPYNIYVLLWYICAPMTYLCSHDIHVSLWLICALWHICAPMTYIFS